MKTNKNKKKPVADSLEEAANPAKAHSPIGYKDQGDYFKLKQPSSVSDKLNTFKQRLGREDTSDYADIKKCLERPFKKLKEKLSKKR